MKNVELVPRQMSLLSEAQEPDESETDALDFSGLDEAEKAVPAGIPELTEEPLFSTLLKRAIAKIEPDDVVLRDFAAFVAPRLSNLLANKTAKGGNFVVDKRAEGVTEAELARYGDDQSMRAHLINGLFPVAKIARCLLRWDVVRFENDFDEQTYRLFCAGFTLHDWLKLPEVEAQLEAAGLRHDTVNPAAHLPIVEQIITGWCAALGLDTFLAALGSLDTYLHDLIYIASNTQVKWGTMRNLQALAKLDPERKHQVNLATDLSTLADYVAYLGRTPIDAARHPAIGALLQSLSDGAVRLTYHHVADVRGVLTNLINNAALAAYTIADVREPLLYAPTGVVYLERRSVAPPPPDIKTVAEVTIDKISSICRETLAADLVGFGRDGKGLKYAPFYELFFTPRQLVPVVAKAARVRTAGKKLGTAATRYAKMRSAGMVPAGANVDLPDLPTVDMLAEGCALLEKIARQHAPQLDAQAWLLDSLGIGDTGPAVTEIPRLANTGGVPYQWYYAAGIAHQRNPGFSDEEWVERLWQIAHALGSQLPDELHGSGWDELRDYIMTHLRFERTTINTATSVAQFARELDQYRNARKTRNASSVCSLCSSAYTIREQRESGILFAPMVFTNKQPLHGNKATRNICAICEMEMMLRQVLMNNSSAVGKRFEGRRLRYLFFYPTYFFTPETLVLLREVASQMRRLSFTTLRSLLVSNGADGTERVDLDASTFQRIEDLLLDPSVTEDPSSDRFFRMRYSTNELMAFAFVGIPPASRDAKDAEAWIHPAFLALALPLLLDVKVVASESMLPLFNEATELPETVAFDGPHPFVTYLTRASRLNLDQVGPALQRLATAYLIHLDGNAKMGASGYDYRWQDMPALARDLHSSPLNAFAYLKKWQRRAELETFGAQKAALYLSYFNYLAPKGDDNMTHAQELVRLYRKFYRHAGGKRNPNTNTILRPISIVSRVVLDADLNYFDSDQALIEAAQGRLGSFIDGIEHSRGTDGAYPYWIPKPERQQALDDFCAYFVTKVYRQAFAGNRAALRGKQLNLLKNACEAVYMDQQRREWAERKVEAEERDVVDIGQPVLDL
jgi:CRISPR-associated protein Csc3